MPAVHLLIKPASGMCNMRCEYCFYHDITEKREQSSYGFMSEETLRHVVSRAFDYAEGNCSIAFQGGEPTLAGLDFFRKAVELEKEYETKYRQKHLQISNAIQTNGFGLTEEWARFFAENHFLVGISVDGTIHTHDACRRDSSGNGTFLSVMHTISLFNACHVDYNILTVVNRKTASSIRKIYAYYKKMGFLYQQYIPCLDPFDAPSGSLPYSLTPVQYGNFLCELFDLWYDDFVHGRTVYIRQFENYVSILLKGHAESCDMNGFCSIQNVVEADGEVYPCDFWVLDAYKLGNLNQVSFKEIEKRRQEIQFLERSHVVHETCKSCPYGYICRGGCYRHRVMTDDRKNYFCESFRTFFDACLPRLQHVARLVQRTF